MKRTTKEKYSWSAEFNSAKAAYPLKTVVKVKSRQRYTDPLTPRSIPEYTYMYALYEPESDSVIIWAYTGKTLDIHDPHDGSWGLWSQREKLLGRRNLNGDWTEPLIRVWEKD